MTRAIVCISAMPILQGYKDAGFVPATVEPHPDAGFVAVKLASGRYRYVDNNGLPADDRVTAGAEERFLDPGGGVLVAVRGGRAFVFAVA